MRREPADIVTVFNESYIPEPNSGCWIWNGNYDGSGYGKIYSSGKIYAAHRVSWEIYNKEIIPKGFYICHKCDVPCCVNPKHLFLGTPKMNCRDKVQKGRHRKKAFYDANLLRNFEKYCPHGHRLNKKNIYVAKGKYINCRRCISISSLKYYHKNK